MIKHLTATAHQVFVYRSSVASVTIVLHDIQNYLMLTSNCSSNLDNHAGLEF